MPGPSVPLRRAIVAALLVGAFAARCGQGSSEAEPLEPAPLFPPTQLPQQGSD